MGELSFAWTRRRLPAILVCMVWQNNRTHAARWTAWRYGAVIVLSGVLSGQAAAADFSFVREEFVRLPRGSELRGRPGTPLAAFEVVPFAEAMGGCVLRMTAEQASGALVWPVEGVDLQRRPVLRWRWRVLEWPTDGDGRFPERDDQAIGLYIGTDRRFHGTSLAYRWETLTPPGQTGVASYAGGLVRVHWIAVRNRDSGAGFFVEERCVVDDWCAFVGGDPPKRFVLSISCNSQYTRSRAVAELDWLEFVPGPISRARATSEIPR